MYRDLLATHGADQPFEPRLYSTRVGFLIGIVAVIAVQFFFAPIVALLNWITGADRNLIDFPGAAAILLAISFPFVARAAHNLLAFRNETRTAAYAVLGGGAYLIGSVFVGGFESLAWISFVVGGAAALAGYRIHNFG